MYPCMTGFSKGIITRLRKTVQPSIRKYLAMYISIKLMIFNS